MANVPLYKQGDLASAAQGTPGVERSAGAADAALGAGAGQLRQNELALSGNNAGLAITAIAGVGAILAKGIANARAARQQQKNLLDDAELANDEMQFRQYVNGAQRDYQDQFKDNPEEAVKAFQNGVNGTLDSLTQKWADNPRVRAKLAEHMKSHVPEEMDKMEGWALTRRSAITQQNLENNISGEVQNIADLQGSINDRLESFSKINTRMQDYLTSMVPIIGQEKATEKLREYNKQAGPALFESMLNNRPEDPMTGINYVKSARIALQSADRLGVTLTADQRKRLQNETDALESKYVKSIITDVQIADMQDSMNMDIFRTQLNARRDDPMYVAQAMGALQDRVQEIKARNEAVQANKDMPDEVKLAFSKWQDSHVKQVNSMINDVFSYKHQQAAEARRDAAEARREANAAARDARAADRLAKVAEKAAFAEQKQSAQAVIGDMKAELIRLAASPEAAASNHEAIVKAAAELYKRAGEAAKDKHLTQEQANSLRNTAINITRDAAHYVNQSGWFGFGGGLKALKKQEKMKAESAAVNQLYATIDELKTQVRHEQINQLQGLNEKQQDAFGQRAAAIEANGKAAGASRQEIDKRLHSLRSLILSDPALR